MFNKEAPIYKTALTAFLSSEGKKSGKAGYYISLEPGDKVRLKVAPTTPSPSPLADPVLLLNPAGQILSPLSAPTSTPSLPMTCARTSHL